MMIAATDQQCAALGVHTNPLIPKHVLARALLLGQIFKQLREVREFISERVKHRDDEPED